VKDTVNMIPMLRNCFACSTRRPRVLGPIAVLFVSLLVTSCSTSKFVLGPLYNRLDDQMRNEFNKLGKFNQEQNSEFEKRLLNYHTWHRRKELPRYAELLDAIQYSVSAPRRTTEADIQSWFDAAESFSVSARECHPVNFSYDLMKTLTDEQVNYIERRFKSEQGKNRKRYDAFTWDERIERRFNFVKKWSGRFGLKLTEEQQVLLKDTMQEQVSMRKQYWRLSAAWNREFFIIGRDQSANDYDARMDAQLAKLWSLLETNYPEQWQDNRDLWKGFAFEFVNSMTTSQREWARGWLGGVASTLRDMSDDKVAAALNPEVGCA